MRHFLLSLPVAPLALGMGVRAAPRALIALSGRPHGALARLLGTGPTAIALTPVAVAADQHGGPASGAQVSSSRRFHWPKCQWGTRRERPLRERLCVQRSREGSGRGIGTVLASLGRCRACFPQA